MKDDAQSFLRYDPFLVTGTLACYCQSAARRRLPGRPYDRHIIYQALVLFWIGIIGLIVIIVMKLKEAKRIQDMDVHKDDEDAPFLD